MNWRSYFRFWRCWGLIGGCFNQCTQSDFCILNEFVITALIWNYSKCIRINCLSKQTCLKHAHRTLVRFPNPHTVGTFMTPSWSFRYARRTIWLSCRKSFSPKRKTWFAKYPHGPDQHIDQHVRWRVWRASDTNSCGHNKHTCVRLVWSLLLQLK